MSLNNPSPIKTRLLIARHGNTFRKEETPRRVGGATDIPLVETQKAENIGGFLRAEFIPDLTFAAPLKRTLDTATIALDAAKLNPSKIIQISDFKEIDYGPDENQAEADVIKRIGQAALDRWNHSAEAPDGWEVDVKALEQRWIEFAKMLINKHQGKNIFLVTSNGIARFAPVILGHAKNNSGHLKINSLKIGTGNICLFEHLCNKDQDPPKQSWTLKFWNRNPTTDKTASFT